MPDWSKLQSDLLGVILSRMDLIEDYLNFSSVCKSWHSVANEHSFISNLPRAPWLMLAEEDDGDEDDNTCRKFYSFYNDMIFKKRVPEAQGKRCMESMGWLITVGKEDGEISLLHPFSGVQIQLPHQNTTKLYEFNQTRVPWNFVKKAVLSANPSHTDDYVLMVIEGKSEFLSFWRPGDLLWTRITKPIHFGHFSDVLYFNGNFYAVGYGGSIQVCDVSGPEPASSRIIVHLERWVDCKYYILESLGSVFVVAQSGAGLRCIQDDRERIPLMFIPGEDDDEEDMLYTYGTRIFLVFKIDLDAHRNTPTRDLGDRAFFLGANASFSVQASQFPGIKPNHIYFIDNCLGAYLHFEEGSGLDMGVFNLVDGSIQPHYDGVSLSRVCPPIWVTPALC
ncbi:hypothetical protein R3W88_012059 [Solanum pinnatisectum]|uniref:F-box domain-containing protein n=1 Tax=Solanum pinnatisectum TaxID=50273 RepID=A0AAV9L7U9_9SOLN|nr:hypothetical protein R3W88_012059 [Solanum pinnatisectum]